MVFLISFSFFESSFSFEGIVSTYQPCRCNTRIKAKIPEPMQSTEYEYRVQVLNWKYWTRLVYWSLDYSEYCILGVLYFDTACGSRAGVFKAADAGSFGQWQNWQLTHTRYSYTHADYHRLTNISILPVVFWVSHFVFHFCSFAIHHCQLPTVNCQLMPSMPVLFHRHLRTICILLLFFIALSTLKLGHLSDPADVDTKSANASIRKPTGASKAATTSTTASTTSTASPITTESTSPSPAPIDNTAQTSSERKQETPTATLTNHPVSAEVSTVTAQPTTIATTTESSTESSIARITGLPTPPNRTKHTSTASTSTYLTNASMATNSTDSLGTIVPPAVIQQTRLNYKPNSDANAIGRNRTFVDEYCALEGAEWFPSTPETKWHQRAPYFVIAGSLEAGVPSITKRLAQHSQLLEHQHPPFFLAKNFKPFLAAATSAVSSSLSSSTTTTTMTMTMTYKKPKILSARQYLYNMAYYTAKDLKNKNNTLLKAFDASTGYLFWSSTVPINLLCTCPWTKIIVVLRNPVDRLMAHYQSAGRLGLKIGIEAWMEADLKLLKDTIATMPSSSTASSSASWWSTYLSLIRDDAPIGRGIYEIQLRQWLSVLDKMGKLDDILILNYEDWRRSPSLVWTRILDFLQLPEEFPSNLPNASEPVPPFLDGDGTTASSSMDPSLRKKLIKYYKPYNRKLYDLLGWDQVWDK